MSVEHGPRERPDPTDEGIETATGKVLSIGIDQEGARDAVSFLLQTYNTSMRDGSGDLCIPEEKLTLHYFVDEGVTVALAQLQLLREAMTQGWWVLVHYSTDDGYPTADHDPWSWVYYVQVRLNGEDSRDLTA